MTITAATPMMIPSIVSIARILFLRMLCMARRIRIVEFHAALLSQLCQVPGRARAGSRPARRGKIWPSRIWTMRVA